MFDVRNAGVDVVGDEMPSIGPRGEVAVIAARRTERDVHIDAEVHGAIVARDIQKVRRTDPRRPARGEGL